MRAVRGECDRWILVVTYQLSGPYPSLHGVGDVGAGRSIWH